MGTGKSRTTKKSRKTLRSGRQATRVRKTPGTKDSTPDRTSSHNESLSHSPALDVVERVRDGFVAFDAHMNYTYVNAYGAALLGRKPEDLIGRNYWKEFPEAKGSSFANAYLKCLENQTTMVLEDYYAPWDRWFENRIYPSTEGLSLFFTEITDRKHAEILLSHERNILEMIAQGESLHGILEQITLKIEAQSRNMFCSILLLDPDGIHVRHGAAPNLPDTFICAIDGQAIGPAAGSCGTAAYRKEPVFVSDIATDPLWADYREVALSHGLRACWSTPIKSATGSILGTFAMYYGEPRAAGAYELRLIGLATHLAKIAIERHQREDILREARERLSLAIRSANIGLWDWDLLTNKVSFTSEWKSQLGYQEHEISNDFSEWEQRVHPDDLDKAKAIVSSFLANPYPNYYNEFRMRHKDGSYRWILAQASLLMGADGTPVRMVGSHIDITERIHAEQSLRRNEQVLRLFVEHSPAAIAMFDRDMRYIVASRRYLADYNLGDEDLTGRSHYDVFPEMPERWKLIHRRCIAGAVEKSDEDPFPRLDGHTDWVRWEIRPWYESRNEIGGIILFSEVITQRKRSEEELRLSEQRFRSIFEDNLAVMLLIDPDSGAIVDANEAAVRFYGWTRERLLSMSVDQINTLPRDVVIKEMNNARELRQVFFEFKHRQSDGVIRDVEVFASRIEIGGREFLHSIVHDVTERKKAEASLRLHATALHSAANAIVITDVEGTILTANPAFCALTGYEQEDVIGRKTSILNSGAQDAAFYRTMWETILLGKVWRNELINRRKDGSHYTEEMTITPVFDDRGQVTHFIAIKQDITQQKALQLQVLQTQKVQSIGTLAGGIAHDFNNILGIIIGHAHMLKRVALDPERLSQNVDIMIRTSERGAALVKQLLTFARKSDVVFQTVLLNDLIREVVTLIQETFPKTITISTDLQRDLPVIAADSGQLHQVLINLCVNARDAMPRGGELHISTRSVDGATVISRQPNANAREYVEIVVRDNGAGMDKATLQKIFEPFFTTKGIGKGTGLGLSVVYGIVQTHQGFIDVISEPGHGTGVTVYLPVEEEELVDAPVQADSDAEIVPGGSETLLLVEDEESLRRLVQAVLQSKGYRVLTASNGEEAIETYLNHRNEISVVICDLGLPKLGGDEVFKKIRDANRDVKIIMASGFVDPKVKSELAGAGMKYFIQKPYVPDEVLRKIRQVIDLGN